MNTEVMSADDLGLLFAVAYWLAALGHSDERKRRAVVVASACTLGTLYAVVGVLCLLRRWPTIATAIEGLRSWLLG